MFDWLIYKLIFNYNSRYEVLIKLINHTIKYFSKILEINNQSVIIVKIIKY